MTRDGIETWRVLYWYDQVDALMDGDEFDALSCGCPDPATLWTPQIVLLMNDPTTSDCKPCAFCFARKLATCPGIDLHVAMERDRSEVSTGVLLHLAVIELPSSLGWELAFAAIKLMITNGHMLSVEHYER